MSALVTFGSPVPSVAMMLMFRIRQGGTWRPQQCGKRDGAKKMSCVHVVSPDVRINASAAADIYKIFRQLYAG
jgi:hypothetical protein